jgi:uncharacterized protein with HEPN domain
MSDILIKNRLEFAQETINVLQSYLSPISTPDDFYTADGSMIYDAILMRLQVLGENVKTINKKDPTLFTKIEEEVSSIIRFRDLISHHYEKLDTDIVYDICTQYIPRLKQQIQELLNTYK